MATAQGRLQAARGHNWRLPLQLALAGLVASFLLAGHCINTQAQPSLDVHIGFNNQFVPNQYTPIRVQITYEGPPLSGELVLRQEIHRSLHPIQSIELRRAIQLGQSARQQYTFYFPLSASPAPDVDEPQLDVIFLAQGKEIAANRMKLADAVRVDPLVLAVSDSGFPRVLPTGEHVEQVMTEELPSDWKGFSSVRRLYLGRFHASTLTVEQQVALQKWLIRGGQLVVLTGENFYLQDAPWLRELLPFQITAIQRVEALAAQVAVGSPRGETLYERAALPLLVRGNWGQGSVYISALDLLEPGNVERLIWAKLTPDDSELLPPAPLGAEIFRQMELQFPPKPLVATLLALYAAGFGFLSLWALRRPRWLIAREAGGWRVFLLIAGWIALFTGLTLGLLQKPEFTRRAQSLEVGLIRGSDQTPWAWMQSWYGVFPKRELALKLPIDRDALVLPQEDTSVALYAQPNQLEIGFSPVPLLAWKPQYLYAEEVLPLQIQLKVDENPRDVRNLVVQVYNASQWTLEDAVLLQRGIYYSLGDLPPGKAREVALNDVGASSWPSMSAGASGQLSFESRVKQQLYSHVQADLERKDNNCVLLAWVVEGSLATQPNENRWNMKLLLIESSKRG